LKLRVRAELLNAFNMANFVPVAGNGTGTTNTYTTLTNYEVTQLNGGPRVAQLVARFTW
jgi:hypothetical protein